MASRSLFAVLIGFSAPLVMAGGCDKCKKEEPPPPIPVATTPPSVPETSLAVEDAGEDVADGDGSDGRKIVGKPAASMKKCCDALAQNATSAPPPTNAIMQQAAAACSVAVGQGKEGAQVLAIVSGLLKGAQMPAACK